MAVSADCRARPQSGAGAFALVVDHWLPWLIAGGVWALFFLPNMLAIDASLSRYPGSRAWRERTGLVLPRLRGR